MLALGASNRALHVPVTYVDDPGQYVHVVQIPWSTSLEDALPWLLQLDWVIRFGGGRLQVMRGWVELEVLRFPDLDPLEPPDAHLPIEVRARGVRWAL